MTPFLVKQALKKERKQFAVIQYKIDTMKDSIVTGQYVCVSVIPAFIILDLLGISTYRNLAFVGILFSLGFICCKVCYHKLQPAYDKQAVHLININKLEQKQFSLNKLKRTKA